MPIAPDEFEELAREMLVLDGQEIDDETGELVHLWGRRVVSSQWRPRALDLLIGQLGGAA